MRALVPSAMLSIIAIGVAPLLAADGVPIAPDLDVDQGLPAVSGQSIVFETAPGGGDPRQVWIHDQLSLEYQRVEPTGFDQSIPDIDGNYILWEDEREQLDGCPRGFYVYDLGSQSGELVLCDQNHYQGRGARISGARIAYRDTAENLRVYDWQLQQHLIAGPVECMQCVDIDGDWVVYEGRTPERDFALRARNLATTEERTLHVDSIGHFRPSISGTRVVWDEARHPPEGSQYVIGMHDLATGADEDVHVGSHNADQPRIDGDWVVWRDLRNGNSDVWAKNLTGGPEFAVCDHPSGQLKIDVSDGVCVWEDERHPTIKVYKADLFIWGVVFAHPWDNYLGDGNEGYPGPEPVTTQVGWMRELGVSAAKPWIVWHKVQPTVNPLDGISWTNLLLHPAQTARLVEDFATGDIGPPLGLVDWSEYDAIMLELAANGIVPVPNIADGGTEHPPEILGIPWLYLNPGNSPQQYNYYLGHVFLFVAGAARRYDGQHLDERDQPLPEIALWNTENELNVAMWAPMLGWRYPCTGWTTPGFLYKLMEVLWRAVHYGNPRAQNTMNISAYDPIWDWTVRPVLPFIDVVGLSVYPNYMGTSDPEIPYIGHAHFADEFRAAEWFGDQVARAVEFADGKAVIIMETGYKSGPFQQDPFSFPPYFGGLTQEQQNNYIDQAAQEAKAHGAIGFFWHKLYDSYSAHPTAEQEWGLIGFDGIRKASFGIYQGVISAHAAATGVPR